MGVTKGSQPRSSLLGAISAGTALVSPIRLDKVGPLEAQDDRADLEVTEDCKGLRVLDRFHKSASIMMCIKLFHECSLPLMPVGQLLQVPASEALQVGLFISHLSCLQATNKRRPCL